MKRLSSILLFAVLAACTQFDKPEYTSEQLNVLSGINEKTFYRDDSIGRISIHFYQYLNPPRVDYIDGSRVETHGEYCMIHYRNWPHFSYYFLSADGRFLYHSFALGGKYDTSEIRMVGDSTLVFGGYSYTKK